MNDVRITRRPAVRLTAGSAQPLEEAVAVESALEIRVDGRTLSVTLRTPGNDRELALGFLAGEAVLAQRADVAELREIASECGDRPDAVDLTLAPGVTLDWTRLERHFAATAACGLCGRAHIESLRAGLTPLPVTRTIDPGALVLLPARLRERQDVFDATGGLHAAAWCDDALEPHVIREDVGRHNAVDKVAGWLLDQDRYPATSGVLWVSGRAGAEIVLKAARARIPVLAAVGAPSSLAIEIAEAAGLTLIGFLREGRMNVYTGRARLAG
jgi:FdhD protein